MEEWEDFKLGFISGAFIIFLLSSCFWNIPAIMKKTCTYKALTQDQITNEEVKDE